MGKTGHITCRMQFLSAKHKILLWKTFQILPLTIIQSTYRKKPHDKVHLFACAALILSANNLIPLGLESDLK